MAEPPRGTIDESLDVACTDLLPTLPGRGLTWPLTPEMTLVRPETDVTSCLGPAAAAVCRAPAPSVTSTPEAELRERETSPSLPTTPTPLMPPNSAAGGSGWLAGRAGGMPGSSTGVTDGVLLTLRSVPGPRDAAAWARESALVPVSGLRATDGDDDTVGALRP